MGVRIRNDHDLGTQQAGSNQNFTPCGIAENHAFAGSRRFPDSLRIQIERNKGNVFLVQKTRQVLAAAPVAADDYMAIGRHRLDGYVVQYHGAIHPLGAAEAARQMLAVLDNEWRYQHGQDQHRQGDLLHGCRQ